MANFCHVSVTFIIDLFLIVLFLFISLFYESLLKYAVVSDMVERYSERYLHIQHEGAASQYVGTQARVPALSQPAGPVIEESTL